MIDTHIHRLVQFGINHGLVHEADRIYTTNQILGVLGINEIQEASEEAMPLESAAPILKEILAYAITQGIIEDTITEKDLLDTKIMNCLMPRPSEVIYTFQTKYAKAPQAATDYFYDVSIASNYIRKERTDKNICWKSNTIYGALDISINLSKPEKDPREIALAKSVKSSSYPKCLLCKENEGYYGTFSHPARNNHRIIPMQFNQEEWFLQYSPYTYYKEHCIVFNAQHIPMQIHRKTFANLFGFLDVLPHYFIGSNADLPIVGGSILSHDHYQGGHYTFAMEQADILETYQIPGYEDIYAAHVNWPMSVLRLRGKNQARLIDLCDHVLQAWRGYSDIALDIVSHTKKEAHNTITPIARMRSGAYEIDLVLRNNRTNAQYPMGIFHPHEEVHHIKKENIGLIEVMGLAVLPARLKDEMAAIATHLLKRTPDISHEDALAKHNDWYQQILQHHQDIQEATVMDLLHDEIGTVFAKVLEHAGVFKLDAQGIDGFNRFIKSL